LSLPIGVFVLGLQERTLIFSSSSFVVTIGSLIDFQQQITRAYYFLYLLIHLLFFVALLALLFVKV